MVRMLRCLLARKRPCWSLSVREVVAGNVGADHVASERPSTLTDEEPRATVRRECFYGMQRREI